MNINQQKDKDHYMISTGVITLALRLVIGWTYFSAFWRRVVLENKLIPDEAGYIGEKFNHFLPNALGIKPLIEYLVTHPQALEWAMIIFTLVEAVVGLFLMLGLFTRLMSIGVFFLAMGILLGSGWIGTTCLDEWQIGVLGLAGGFVLFISGSDRYSLDAFFMNKNLAWTHTRFFRWFASGPFPWRNSQRGLVVFAVIIFGMTLFTNQYFHGGVWGKLHNKSVKPKVEISNVKILQQQISFEIYRVEGADVYGSFLIGIQLLDDVGTPLLAFDSSDLAAWDQAKIHNHYVAKVKPGKYSMIIPLGAKADLTIDLPTSELEKVRGIRLIDISGVEWLNTW